MKLSKLTFWSIFCWGSLWNSFLCDIVFVTKFIYFLEAEAKHEVYFIYWNIYAQVEHILRKQPLTFCFCLKQMRTNERSWMFWTHKNKRLLELLFEIKNWWCFIPHVCPACINSLIKGFISSFKSPFVCVFSCFAAERSKSSCRRVFLLWNALVFCQI